jgi:hypothetical protein
VALIFSAKGLVAVGEIELMSITILPGRRRRQRRFRRTARLDLRGVRHHDDDEFGFLGHFLRVGQGTAPAATRSAGAASWCVDRNRL